MFKALEYTDVIDIALMSVLIYPVLVSFKRTRAAFVLTGMIIIAAVYLVAQQFNLFLTESVFRWFFAVILFAWVVIFQEEIRRFFEQVAFWSFHRHMRRAGGASLPREEIAVLARALADMAREQVGAIVVLPGTSMVLGHLQGGMELGGRVSEELIRSIFDPHSIGHDGAMIIRGNIVTRFGAHLPLSKNVTKLRHGGTRHAAALGLSELTDALCIVVSEERGTISVAHNGDIRSVGGADELVNIIERFYQEVMPVEGKRRWLRFVRSNIREKLFAVGLAMLLWFVQVYGSKMIYRTFTLPIEFIQPDASISVAIDPAEVEATFAGPRRVLNFLGKNEMRIFVKKISDKTGIYAVRLTRGNMVYPSTISLESIEPPTVTVRVTGKSGGDGRSEGD